MKLMETNNTRLLSEIKDNSSGLEVEGGTSVYDEAEISTEIKLHKGNVGSFFKCVVNCLYLKHLESFGLRYKI